MQREAQDRTLKTVEQRHTIDFFKDTLKTLIHQSDKKPVGRCLVTMGHSQIRTQTHTSTQRKGIEEKKQRWKLNQLLAFYCDAIR